MSLTNILNTVAQPANGCCTSLYNAGAKGVNWLSNSTKAVTSGAGETLSRVWQAVKNFFSQIGTTIAAYSVAVKDTIVAGFSQLGSLPREATMVLVTGVGLLALTVLGLGYCRPTPGQQARQGAEQVRQAEQQVIRDAAQVAQAEQQVAGQPVIQPQQPVAQQGPGLIVQERVVVQQPPGQQPGNA